MAGHSLAVRGTRAARAAAGAALIALAGGAGCEVAPLQVVGTPEEHIRAPETMPAIPPPDPRAVELPPGYRAEVVLDGLIYPTSVEFGDDGSLYVAESGYVYGDPSAPARVLRFTREGEREVVASQLNGPVTDLLWHDGRLYISHRGVISAVDSGGNLRDLVTGLPSLGDHHNNQLAAGPDGRLYFGQGTATNSGVVGVDNFIFGWLRAYPGFHDTPAQDIRLRGREFLTLNPFLMTQEGEPPMATTGAFAPFGEEADGDLVRGATKANGTILAMNPDGSGLEVYAWGLRNPFGVAWGPDGRLYCAENGFDSRGSRPIANAPDVLWAIEPGAWYGWPDFAAGVPVTDDRFKPEDKDAPEFLMAEHPPVGRPLGTRPPHAGTTKLDISRSERFGFPGQIFLAEFGDITPVSGVLEDEAGYGVVRIDPRTGRSSPFFRVRRDALGPEHFEHAATPGPRRPVDVVFSPDGSEMYVVDIGAIAVLPTAAPTVQPFEGTGVVWRVVRDGSRVGSAR